MVLGSGLSRDRTVAAAIRHSGRALGELARRAALADPAPPGPVLASHAAS